MGKSFDFLATTDDIIKMGLKFYFICFFCCRCKSHTSFFSLPFLSFPSRTPNLFM